MSRVNFSPLDFPHAYRCESLDLVPATDEPVLQFNATDLSNVAYSVLRVHAQPNSWIGCFETGDGRLQGAFALPSPTCFLMIAKGNAFLVDVVQRSAVSLPFIPIQDVQRASDAVVACTHTDVLAFGREGIAWVAKDVVTDELHFKDVTGPACIVSGWAAARNEAVDVALEIETGRILWTV